MSEEDKPAKQANPEDKPPKPAEKQSETQAEKPAEKSSKLVANIAVIRVRGAPRMRGDIEDTLTMLRLHRTQTCIILKNTPSNMGMVRKAKDYITWGEIDDVTLKELVTKKGEPNPKDKKITKPFFRLNPPRGGYGGNKKPFSKGGALGDRKEKINELIRRML